MEKAVEVEVSVEKKDKKEPDEWEINDWCRTLEQAQEIEADPMKMKHVKKKMAEKMKAYKKYTSIDQLREASKKMKKSDYEDED